MTYKIHHNDDGSIDIKNENGEVIGYAQPPFREPDDIVEAILDDTGVGNPQREAFIALFTKDWEHVGVDW
jgi:hypothetical protein